MIVWILPITIYFAVLHWMIVSTHGLPPFQSYAEWPVNVDDLPSGNLT